MKAKLTSLVVVLLMLTAACGGGGSSSGPKLTKVKVGALHTEVVDVGLRAGVVAGTFKAHGLDVQIVKFDDGPSLNQALVSGSINIGISGAAMTSSLAARGQAMDVGVLSIENTTEQIIALKGSGINSIKDLKGKKVAVPVGTSADIILQAALTANGLKGSDIKRVNSNASGTATAAISGSVPAASVWVPFADRIMQHHPDAKILLTGGEFFPDLGILCGIAANNKYYEGNKDLLVKFVAAALQGTRAAVDDEKTLQAVWKDQYSKEETFAAFKSNWKTTLFPTLDEWTEHLKEDRINQWLNGTQEILVELGGLDKVNDPKTFFDQALFEKAIALARSSK